MNNKKILKKFLSFILSFVLMFTAAPFLPMITAFAESINSRELVDGVYYEVIDNEAVVTGYSTSKAEIIINSEYKGYPVTKIKQKAFYCSPTKDRNGTYYTNIPVLESITIPNTIKSIGRDAFSGCNNIKKVIINDITNWCSINFENEYANPLYYSKFKYLKSVWQGGTFHSVIYEGCKSTELRILRAGINYPLQDLIIDNRFEQISNFCFSGCKNIVNVRFCTNLENIGSYSFYNCQSLEFVNFEKTVKNIGNNAFEGCIALEKIYIGDVIKYIGDNAFYNCNNLKSVNINDLKSWFEINFANYYANPLYYNKNYQGTDKTTNLLIDDIKTTSIKTPDNVSQINNYALAGCNSLEVLEISENIETVGGKFIF